MKLAEHGGKRGKKRAVIAVAVSSAQLGSLRLRDRARRIIQIAPGGTCVSQVISIAATAHGYEDLACPLTLSPRQATSRC